MQTLHREQEIDQTANLKAEAGHDRLLHNADIDAEPIPELEFDQASGKSCAAEMAHAAECGLVWIRHWLGVVSGVVFQIRIAVIVHFLAGTRIKSLLTPLKSGL